MTTEKGTKSFCDPAETELSVQPGQSTTAPKEAVSAALGLISMERGKPSCFSFLFYIWRKISYVPYLYIIANDRATDTSNSFTALHTYNKQFSLNIGLQTFLPQHLLPPQCSKMRPQHEVNGPSFSP